MFSFEIIIFAVIFLFILFEVISELRIRNVLYAEKWLTVLNILAITIFALIFVGLFIYNHP